MDFKKLKLFVDELCLLMNKNCEEAFNLFISHWSQFDDDERKILTTLLLVISTREIKLENIQEEKTLYWFAILNHIDKPVINTEKQEEDYFPRLTLKEGINGNQIVKIFHDLKKAGHIESSYELIAEAISIIFPIEYNTAYNDLTVEKRLVKAKKLLY